MSSEGELCAIHGAAKIRLGSQMVCSTCLAEKSAPRIERLSQRNQQTSSQEQKDTRLQCGIPLIYHAAQLDALDLPRDEANAQSFARVARAMKRFADEFERFRRERPGFLFTGDAGTGKTHLACAIANRLIDSGATAAYVSLPSLTIRVRASYGNDPSRESVKQIIARYSQADLLILDEIDLHGGGMGDFQVLYEILNNRYASGYRPTIAVSNQSKAFLVKDLGDRIIDRICGASPEVSFGWLPFRGAAQIQKVKASKHENQPS